jgi:CheY-like chemotaxis protein
MNSSHPFDTPPSPSTDAGLPLIGQYLVAAGSIGAHQISAAVRQAYRLRTRLGFVLLQHSLVSPVTLADALVVQTLDRQLAGLPTRYLGERLLKQGLITPDQLAAALYSQLVREQQWKTALLGQLLVAQGVIDQDVLRAALAAEGDEPATPTSITPALAPPEPEHTRPTLQKCALILEDDPVLGESLKLFIQQLTGLPVQHLTRAQEARAYIHLHQPRLVLTDRRLPDGDGLALAAELRAQYEGMAIVLMTADTSPALVQLMQAVRLRQSVAKPFALEELAHAVADALRDTEAAV